MTVAPTLAELVVPIGSVKPYGRNPRRGDVEAIKRSLEVNGQYRPIVVNRRTGEVLAGNHTLRAAAELGWTGIAATFVDVDDEQAARIVLADNRTAELGGYDDGELVELLGSLPELDGSGWQDIELQRLLAQLERQAVAGRDTDPGAPPAEPRTRPGEVWALGGHRLACGDATDPTVWAALLQGTVADVCIADPPYGVHYQGGAQAFSAANGKRKVRRVLGDEDARLYAATLPFIADALRPDGALYLWFSDSRSAQVLADLREAGFKQRCVLIWAKDVPTGSLLAHYIPRHEPIVYASIGERAPRWFGPTNETTVWEHPKPRLNEFHPTQKPVALLERALNNSSRPGEVVLDPFLGSGSTLIAAENLERRCYAIELDPGYCDVVVDRWERHTGGKAEPA